MSLLSRLRKHKKETSQHATGHLSLFTNGVEVARVEQDGQLLMVPGVDVETAMDALSAFFVLADACAGSAGDKATLAQRIERGQKSLRMDTIQ
jgi:hypothetical protein